MRFSDIVRELDLTQGTAHGILKTLFDRAGWAANPSTKTFALGPALTLFAPASTSPARWPISPAPRFGDWSIPGMPASVLERAGDIW